MLILTKRRNDPRNLALYHFSYLVISIGLTIWVARTLQHSGRVFLVEAFHGQVELADSVNHLLVVGFYLINIGYIALALRTESPMTTFRQIIELESVKIGVVLLILGGMRFFNILSLCQDAQSRQQYVAQADPASAVRCHPVLNSEVKS